MDNLPEDEGAIERMFRLEKERAIQKEKEKKVVKKSIFSDSDLFDNSSDCQTDPAYSSLSGNIFHHDDD